jgi:pyocin large subunit-like protein
MEEKKPPRRIYQTEEERKEARRKTAYKYYQKNKEECNKRNLDKYHDLVKFYNDNKDIVQKYKDGKLVEIEKEVI